MTFTEAMDYLGMGKTAFYKLRDELGIKSDHGEYEYGDIQRMMIKKQSFRTWPRYRVSILENGIFVTKHIGVTKKEALRLRNFYRRCYTRTIIRSMDGKTTL